MNYKAIIEKQKKLIKYLINCIENGYDYQIDTLVVNKFQSELAALEVEEGTELYPVDLEQVMKAKEVKSAAWECPRCHKIHSYLSLTCDCPANTFTSTTGISDGTFQ
jgi:hypothetical protein